MVRLSLAFAMAAVLFGLSVSAGSATFTVPTGPECYDYFTSTTHYATNWLDAPGTLNGTPGDDVLVGSTGSDVINGKGGNDIICEVAATVQSLGPDTIFGGSGSDYIFGSGVSDGGSGNDRILAFGENAYGKGGSGNDTLRADYLATVDGGSGNDFVYSGFGGADGLYGGSGSDRVENQTTANLLDCGSARDRFVANGAPSVFRCEVPVTI